MHVLITGGAGFIGSHLCEALAAAGHTLTVLDDLSTGHPENLRNCPHRFIEGDVADPSAVRTAMENSEAVFHLAAIASVPKTFEDPRRSLAVNLGGTINVLEAARECGTRRVIFSSSAAIYGMGSKEPQREDAMPSPLSPYAVEKLGSEYHLKSYAANYGLETAALRFFNVFGPRQDPSSPYSGVISLFCKRLSQGEPVTIYGDGEQSRDFVSVFDVVRALMLALVVPQPKGLICNIARGSAISINRLYEILAKLFRSDQKPVYAPARAGDPRASLAAVDRARELLGFTAQISLEEGLSKLVESL